MNRKKSMSVTIIVLSIILSVVLIVSSILLALWFSYEKKLYTSENSPVSQAGTIWKSEDEEIAFQISDSGAGLGNIRHNKNLQFNFGFNTISITDYFPDSFTEDDVYESWDYTVINEKSFMIKVKKGFFLKEGSTYVIKRQD